MPALRGARGSDDSHVHRKNHKSGPVEKKMEVRMPVIEPLWRRAFGHLVALVLSTLFAPRYNTILRRKNQPIPYPSCLGLLVLNLAS